MIKSTKWNLSSRQKAYQVKTFQNDFYALERRILQMQIFHEIASLVLSFQISCWKFYPDSTCSIVPESQMNTFFPGCKSAQKNTKFVFRNHNCPQMFHLMKSFFQESDWMGWFQKEYPGQISMHLKESLHLETRFQSCPDLSCIQNQDQFFVEVSNKS